MSLLLARCNDHKLKSLNSGAAYMTSELSSEHGMSLQPDVDHALMYTLPMLVRGHSWQFDFATAPVNL